MKRAVCSFLVRGAVCLVASFVLLYVCDVPSSQAMDAPIWQALLLDGDDADPSEVKLLPVLHGQPGFASACLGMDRVRCRQFGYVSESILFPRSLLVSSVPARAPPAA